MKTISKQNAEHYKWGDDCDGWHLVKNKNISVIEECVPSGASETMHYHKKSEQVFYVLSGIATMIIDGKEIDIHANQSMHVLQNTPHQLKNNQQDVLRFLVISTPPSHGDKVDVLK